MVRLHRKGKVPLRPRFELLFLPRSAWFLPNRFPSGCACGSKLQICILCFGFSPVVRGGFGTVCLWLALPVRTGTGPSPQNPISQKAPKNSRRLLAEISQIPDFGGVCDPFAALCSEFYRAGPTMVLQIYLSIRHFAWRMAACLCKPLATADDRVAVCMEKSDSGGSAGSVHADLSSVLQVSLPTRCDLRAF